MSAQHWSLRCSIAPRSHNQMQHCRSAGCGCLGAAHEPPADGGLGDAARQAPHDAAGAGRSRHSCLRSLRRALPRSCFKGWRGHAAAVAGECEGPGSGLDARCASAHLCPLRAARPSGQALTSQNGSVRFSAFNPKSIKPYRKPSKDCKLKAQRRSSTLRLGPYPAEWQHLSIFQTSNPTTLKSLKPYRVQWNGVTEYFDGMYGGRRTDGYVSSESKQNLYWSRHLN